MQILADATRRLTGPGAATNAGYEVKSATRAVVDLDAQLRRASDPTPRRAA